MARRRAARHLLLLEVQELQQRQPNFSTFHLRVVDQDKSQQLTTDQIKALEEMNNSEFNSS